MKKFFAVFAILFAMAAQAAMTPQQAYDYVTVGLDGKNEREAIAFRNELSHDIMKLYAERIVQMCEATNGVYATVLSHLAEDAFFYWCAEKLTTEECAAFDARISVLPNRNPSNGHLKFILGNEYSSFPKTFEAWVKEGVIKSSASELNVIRHYTAPHAKGGLELAAAKLNDEVCKFNFNKWTMDTRVKDVFLPATRMRLRARGEGFVVRRDGFNPLKDVLDRVQDALNAPKQRGLKELVESYVPGYTWIEPEYPGDMELMVLVGDVLSGKVDVKTCQGKLFFTLGAEQYNEFVRTYNGRQ